MEVSPISQLPQDTLYQIFSTLPLRQIVICRSVCKLFHQILTSPSFIRLLSAAQPPLRLLTLRPSHRRHNHHGHASPHPTLDAFDPDSNQWLRFPLAFLPFVSPHPVASSAGIVYFWADSPDSTKSLVACNPLTRLYRVLPQLGSAWSRHGSVLVDPSNRVLVLSQLATLYFRGGGSNNWLKFSSNLPSKPRSPVLVSDSVYVLCDVGNPWRSQWKLFCCTLKRLQKSRAWDCLERHEWGDVFDKLKRPRLVQGVGNGILMVGGWKSSFSLNTSCSAILILKLDLESLEWDEAGWMPPEMYSCFQESSKFKVFGAGNLVCFSAKRVGRLALWDCSAELGKGEWRWIDWAHGNGDGFNRGFVFEPRLPALP